MTALRDVDHNELAVWRRDLHAHPELAFAEHRTSAFVADKLQQFGIEVTTGLGRTGVVGVLRRGESDRCIMLRADMDALPIHEAGNVAHRSTTDGVMHACGHDGHITMLLGAAKNLASRSLFDGTICFVFQPAEEGGGGAAAMIADGLFDRFPATEVHGLHNLPGLGAGRFATRSGSLMAAYDTFLATLIGPGGHAAFPQASPDMIGHAIELVAKLRAAGTKSVSPFDPHVLSVTAIEAPSAPNVIPSNIAISGSFRTFTSHTRNTLKTALDALVCEINDQGFLKAAIEIQSLYPPLINASEPTNFAIDVVKKKFGSSCFDAHIERQLASEDFAFMLQERPGCFMLLGNGGIAGGCALHSPNYDFNDAILPQGVLYWIELAQALLPKSKDS